MLTTIPYDQMKFVWVTNHYDIHWAGLCRVDGSLCRFETRDETDYQRMNDGCPYCGDPNNDNIDDCSCLPYVDIVCDIYPLTVIEKFKWLCRKSLFEFCVGTHWSYPKRKDSLRKARSKWLMQLYYKLSR